MNKKLMSLGLVGILSVSLMAGCDSSNNEDDTITIKYVDKDGNIKREKVTKEEAKQIEENQKSQTTKNNSSKNNSTTKKETNKQQPKQHKEQVKEDPTTNNHNYDEELYGNAMLGTCPDCGRNGMVFNHGDGLKCAYCGFYDPYYYVDEEPDQGDSGDNKDDENIPDDTNDYDDYDETQDYEESPSEPVEENMN